MNTLLLKLGCLAAVSFIVAPNLSKKKKSTYFCPKHYNPTVLNLAPSAFNAVAFEAAVDKKMGSLCKGYAFAIADKNGIRARAEGGWAQDPADGNLRMSTTIPSCIGSVTKMMSAAALLNLLEAMPNEKLDDPVFSKLPIKWQQKYKNTRVEKLTYRQLLQHKSGFRKGSDTGNLDSMATFPNSAFSAKRSYNNSNISLFRYLISSLAYPADVAAIEKKAAGLPFDEYSEKVNIDYGFPYEKYVRKHILEKGLTPITAGCRPEPDFAPKVAKGYSDRNDKTGEFTNTAAEHIAKGNHCAPQGSWYFSAEMLCHFARTLLYSNNYLTPVTLNMLFDDNNPDERLGWASYESHEKFNKETGQLHWPSHGGAQNGYFAMMMQLPNGYVGTALVNSSKNLDADSNGTATGIFLRDVIIESFYEATHAGTLTEIAKHAIPENKYQDEFNMIWNSGYYPSWIDAYEVNGKIFFNAIFRPNKDGQKVKARHGLSKDQYQQQYDEWVKQKEYRLEQIDSYNDGGLLKFSVIFIKRREQAAAQPAYHGVSPEEHQALLEKYTDQGFVPVNVSVAKIRGKRFYTAFYEKNNVGGQILKSFLTQQEYQVLFDDMSKKKWKQVYVNAYQHNGQTRFSAIWYERSGYHSYTATRKSSSSDYQQKWETNTGNGMLTCCVTGYEESGKHWFAALWAK